MNMCRLLVLVVSAAIAVIPNVLAQSSDNYPTRPITLIVPFAPGGGNDIMARLIGEHMSRSLGQQVVIDNRAGGGGNIGSRQVARSAPNGYTMLLAFTGTLGINPSLYENLGYDPNTALSPIGSIATASAVLVVHPSLPAQNLKDLIAYAKANPGVINYASSGVGTVVHVATEMLANAAGIDIKQVPYRGTGPAISDLIGGHVKMMMAPIPALIGHVQEGKVRAALADANVRKRLIDDGATPAADSPEDYGAAIARDQQTWGAIVRKLGLRVQ